MPNDAKLGLLTGVIGVIAVAVLSMNQPAPVASPPVPSTQFAPPIAQAPIVPDPAAEKATDPPSTPVVKTRREPDATPAGRTSQDDIDR